MSSKDNIEIELDEVDTEALLDMLMQYSHTTLVKIRSNIKEEFENSFGEYTPPEDKEDIRW